MRRDPKAFRERFAAWKNGELVYDAGRIISYAEGKDAEYWDAVRDFISQYEGFKDTTYLDGKGIPTIGYGFTDSTLTRRGKISRAEADKYLIDRLRKEDQALRDTLSNWDELGTDAKKALISYRYNYPAGFKDTTNFMKYWNAGDYMNAIKEVDAGWNDTANPGLRTRRMAEQELLRADPFLSGNANVNIPIETPADPIFNKPEPSLDFTAPRLSTDVNQPFRAVSADRKIDNSAGWKAISHLLTLDILKDLADGYDWQTPKLPSLFPLRANQWTLSLIGYEGGKDSNTYLDLATDFIPIYGTYKDYERFEENPNWKTGGSLALSALGDIAMLAGVGAVAKGALALGKAGKINKAANTANKAVEANRAVVRSTSKALKRLNDAILSLTLMDAPLTVITDRARKLNNARNAYNSAITADKIGLQTFRNLQNEADILENSANTYLKAAPLIFADPAFHAGSRMVGYEGGKDNNIDLAHTIDKVNDSAVGIAVKLLDPTGISSYYDVYKAYNKFKDDRSRANTGELIAETLGAIPLIGKFGKAFKLANQFNSLRKMQKVTKNIYKLRAIERTMEDVAKQMYDLPKAPMAASATLRLIGNSKDVVDNISNNYAEGKDALPGYTTGEDGGFFNWLKNAVIGASVADAPAVATASGWHNEDGQWRLNRTAADELLGLNMSVLSTFSPTHPATAAIDWGIKKVVPLLRLPVSEFVADAANQSKKLKRTLSSHDDVIDAIKAASSDLIGVGGSDRFEQLLYDQYIHGNEVPYLYVSKPRINKSVSDEMKAIYKNSVEPRLELLRPWMDSEQVADGINRALDEGYSVYDDAIFKKAGRPDWEKGFYSPRSGRISIRDGYEDFAMGHEIRHRVDDMRIPLVESEENLLRESFNDDFINLSNTVDDLKGVDMSEEMVTTNFDGRNKLLGEDVLAKVPVSELNVMIDNATYDLMVESMRKANGYGQSYVEALIKKYGKVPEKIINAWKESYKYVGMFGGAAAVTAKTKKKQLK